MFDKGWYTEATPSNRMALSIRSGLHSEVAWALDRLVRLGGNEQFSYKSYPGLIDGLFDWPEWYVTQGYTQLNEKTHLFGPSKEFLVQHRFALESLLILRNISLQDQAELASHSHTLSLLLNGLNNLDFTKDENQEALLHIVDIFQSLAHSLYINEGVPDISNPIIPLKKIVSKSTNRSLIIAAFGALTGVLSHPGNTLHFARTSESLNAAIRYLPLFMDRALVEPCLEHLYIHVAHPGTARAFLLNPELPSVLRVLCSLILAEQHSTEEKVTLDITPPFRTVAATSTMTPRNYELTSEDIGILTKSAEPHRCYEWLGLEHFLHICSLMLSSYRMRLVLQANADAEMTQVDIWTLYKETFTPHQETAALLGASDVIKYVTHVYPSAQAMVLQGQPPRFIVRGIERRREMIATERFKCKWDRSACAEAAFSSPSDLFDHVLQHIATLQPPILPCLWSTCKHTCTEVPHLRSHLLTHLPSSQPPQKHPSQSDTITVVPNSDISTTIPTTRPIPPLRASTISYQRPIVEPSSAALTALLIIRVLFRTASASAEAAPKADKDHFGFPGIVEDDTDPTAEASSGDPESDKEGERKGRRAFSAVRHMLENIRIHDEALMSWVDEMIDSSMHELV
uniref:Uncharacterized protein UP5 n=1 Tax=Coprinellus disseminatus TaxID=71703 RepID=Q1WMT5_COPDI|nr:conserved hypothetical protein [Coprinellus disseminatus]